MRWLEVSLTLEGEQAEAVADLLARHAIGGVAVESTFVLDDRDQGHPAGPVIVRAYLDADASLDLRRRQIEEGLWHLGQIRPLPAPEYRPIQEQDWSEAWKANYRPIPVGRRLLILPAWLPMPKGDRLPILLDPGMAFGTGTHPTTQLVLAELETELQPGDHVADLGCGSGILSIAAARLGAARVLALDIDPLAVSVARENAAGNAVQDRIEVREGSLDTLLELAAAPAVRPRIVLANILAPVLEDMLRAGLAEAVQPGGVLVLSGILEEQLPALLMAAGAAELEVVRVSADADWRAVVLKHAPPPDAGGGVDDRPSKVRPEATSAPPPRCRPVS